MSHNQTLCINKVDTTLREQQRKALNAALDHVNTFGELSLNVEQVEALTGVLNMLDAWSDGEGVRTKRYTGTVRRLEQALEQVLYCERHAGWTDEVRSQHIRQVAHGALVNPQAPSPLTKPRLAVVLEGGVVQAVASDNPACCDAVVIDYDDSCDEDKVTPVVQSDGSTSLAWVYDATPQASAIDLDALWREVYGDE